MVGLHQCQSQNLAYSSKVRDWSVTGRFGSVIAGFLYDLCHLAVLNDIGNEPSAKDKFANRAMPLANTPLQSPSVVSIGRHIGFQDVRP